MGTTYIRPGETLPVALSGTVAVDDVDVVGTGLLGVALVAGVSGDTINYSIAGVHRLPKASAAVIAQGEQVLWDASAVEVDDDAATPAAGDFLCGYAMEAAGSGVLTVEVLINRAAPTVT
jgi:predicted RecA/RadA family phage recombinase